MTEATALPTEPPPMPTPLLFSVARLGLQSRDLYLEQLDNKSLPKGKLKLVQKSVLENQDTIEFVDKNPFQKRSLNLIALKALKSFEGK